MNKKLEDIIRHVNKSFPALIAMCVVIIVTMIGIGYSIV